MGEWVFPAKMFNLISIRHLNLENNLKTKMLVKILTC